MYYIQRAPDLSTNKCRKGRLSSFQRRKIVNIYKKFTYLLNPRINSKSVKESKAAILPLIKNEKGDTPSTNLAQKIEQT